MTYRRTAVAVAAALSLPAAVQAFSIDTGSPDTQVRLDFTAKYSNAFRLKNAQSPLTGTPADPGTYNENDGDNNFSKGLISNRVDLLTEFDVTSTWGGLRLSGTGFYDDVYRRANDNSAANVVNRYPGQPANEFTGFTRRQHGADAQLLDAFAFVKTQLGGGASAVVRVGKHTLLYGESLFFGQNGIAAAQGPVDVAKAVSVPGWQFKEVLLPVEQLSTQVQLRPGLSVGGYYQFKWRPSRIPGAGSYFSNQEYIGTEATYVDLSGLVALGVPGAIARQHLALYDSAYDVKPKNNGQGGVQLKWTPAGSEFEYGFYAARYHDKAPAVPVIDLINDRVNTVWAQGITTFGSSVTSSWGQLNWALEGSIRLNAPLNSDPAMSAGVACGNTGSNRCYTTGKTAHLNLSSIYVLQPTALWGGGAWLTELAWNRTLAVKQLPSAALFTGGGVDPNTTRDAYALRTMFSPTYFQVLPQLDVTVPITLGYNFKGRSSAVGNFAGGVAYGGDMSMGLQGQYAQVWTAQMTFTHYLGKGTPFTEATATGRQLTFGQTLKDRDYLSLSLQRSF